MRQKNPLKLMDTRKYTYASEREYVDHIVAVTDVRGDLLLDELEWWVRAVTGQQARSSSHLNLDPLRVAGLLQQEIEKRERG